MRAGSTHEAQGDGSLIATEWRGVFFGLAFELQVALMRMARRCQRIHLSVERE